MEGSEAPIRRMRPCRHTGSDPIRLHDDHQRLKHASISLRQTFIKVPVFALHPHEVNSQNEDRDDQGRGSRPPNDGRAQQIIFRLVVAPATHPETEIHEWPIDWLGGQDIFLVRIGDQSVV